MIGVVCSFLCMKYLLLLFALYSSVFADPQLSSWFTKNSTKYARLYETKEKEVALESVTTWDRGAGVQALPTYPGVHEISSSNDWVYIRTTGLASHMMGPWYLNEAKTNLFPNYPSNSATIYRIPRTPVVPAEKTPTGGGAIGYYVNGVAMFNALDTLSYSNSEAADNQPNGAFAGDGVWNRDAYVNEKVTFDSANAHSAGNLYHYHAGSPGLRHQLGDSVDYDATTNTYTENPGSPIRHSPIVGWAADGYPVYGPYGYTDPQNIGSTVKRMTSGYAKRAITEFPTQRTTLPQWAADIDNRSTVLATSEYGPPVNTDFILGHYVEDYEFLGNGDLDLYNGRLCKTPEYPAGTYAYFLTIEADGTPVFPYSVGTAYYGTPSGSTRNNINEAVDISFEGGPETVADNPVVDSNNDDLVISWDTIEGGKYDIQSSTTLEDNSWLTEQHDVNPGSDMLSFTFANVLATEPKKFFRLKRTELADFDDTGFGFTNTTPTIRNNILLLIIDDWGIDASVFDNVANDPGNSFAPMPNLQTLVNNGLRFTNAYAQPTCSVTRASIITGRHPFRNGVGNPTAGNTLASEELALPEIFTNQASPYAIGSFGKWHLGSGDNGPLTNGGWTEFRGIIQGAVDSYTNWDKTINGVTTSDVTTYTTTDQVNDTAAFITAQGANPWFAWVGFNAPHDPFHNPPNGEDGNPLESYPSYPENADGEVTGANRIFAYQAALQALDTEIGRLLTSVDLTTTNIIIIGDNGTPAQVVQAPFANDHAKGSLNQGGTHVPLIAIGPDIHASGTSDKLVHCVDLFSTILDIAKIDKDAATAGVVIDSNSLVPIFNGSDTEDRSVVVEQFGDAVTTGRGIISDDYPDYKLIILGSPTDITDEPEFFFYNITNDIDERSPIDITNLSATHQIIYDHLLAKDAALGGGYSDPATTQDTIYIQLPITTGPSSAPQNVTVLPTSVTIDGVTATVVGRVDVNDVENRYIVKCTISPSSPNYTNATVIFTNLGGGDPTRTFTVGTADITVNNP